MFVVGKGVRTVGIGKGCFVCSTSDSRERERQRWYHTFDDATTALIALGVTRENLVDRIGGTQNA